MGFWGHPWCSTKHEKDKFMLWAFCEYLAFRKQWQVWAWVALWVIWGDSLLGGTTCCLLGAKWLHRCGHQSLHLESLFYKWWWAFKGQKNWGGEMGKRKAFEMRETVWPRHRGAVSGVFMDAFGEQNLMRLGNVVSLDYEGSGEGGRRILANGNRRFSIEGFWVHKCYNSLNVFL